MKKKKSGGGGGGGGEGCGSILVALLYMYRLNYYDSSTDKDPFSFSETCHEKLGLQGHI